MTDDDIDVRTWNEVLWAISMRADPVRDTVLVENTPIDYLDFASPRPGLGGKMGSETGRAWGRVARIDENTQRRVDELAKYLGI